MTDRGPDLFAGTERDNGSGPEQDLQSSAARHTLRGEVLRVVFASDDGRYGVLRVLDDSGVEQTLVGPVAELLEGQDIEAEGHWETHKDHGRQFRVESFKAILPTSELGIRRYLGSGVIPGIGPTMADRIVEHFGTATLDVLDRSSKRLLEVPGIGTKRVGQIREAWAKHADQRETRIFLQGLGLGIAACNRVLQQFGAGAGEVVRHNPYRLASEVHGIGFLTADRIADSLGIRATDPSRLTAGVLYVLDQLSDQGHVCVPEQRLIEEAATVLEVPEASVGEGLARALRDGAAVRDAGTAEDGGVRVYARHLYMAETELSQLLGVLLRRRGPVASVSIDEESPGIRRLNQEQVTAVRLALERGVSLITGGPGVGKTTVVGEIVREARRLGAKVYLTAPTGRAAKRLSESCGMGAKTIHRLLKWEPAKHCFVHGPDKPLHCNLLVVDEVSMLDVNLACHLFRAVDPRTHVVLVGDKDQLPSVGPGHFLHDLIRCGRVPVTYLTRIYRQGANSRIVTNAHAVNAGRLPDLRNIRDRQADFFWIEQADPERVVRVITRMVCERIPQRFGLDPIRDVQVLVPMRRGACGTIAMNHALQEALNGSAKMEFRVGERRFRVGDRVMQTANNYDKGVYNGEMGRITAIDYTKRSFGIEFDIGDVEYEWFEADQIQLAYAVTVHKSQGSEFPAVIMPLLNQHYVMLQRNLLYTGMTRAKRLLILVGTRKALSVAVGTDRPASRSTCLAERIALECPVEPDG
jgi:exodeoxyribonuclease V alpha subunit